MRREWLSGKSGFPVPCVHTLTGEEQTVCVLTHGFGSGKDGETARRALAKLPRQGIGVLTFDFPGHGESHQDSRELTVEGCLDDLATAEARARQLCPHAQVVYFGSSFGAYVILHYLSTRPHVGKRAFLRSAAVDMPAIYRDFLDQGRALLGRAGDFLAEEGYDRPIWMTETFAADLIAHSVWEVYEPGMAELAMVHGAEDAVASPEAARRFARENEAELTVFPGEGHSLAGPGVPEQVLRLAAGFFLKNA